MAMIADRTPPLTISEDKAAALAELDDRPTSATNDFARLYRSRIYEFCIAFLRDEQRANAVCERILEDASAEHAATGQPPTLHDWLRRIADHRCHQAVEEQVLELLARGERRAAVTEIFEVYAVRILGFCRQLLRDPQLAEDVAQQALLEACRDIEGYQRRGALYAWMRGIARNRCLDAIRKRKVESRFEGAQESEPACTSSVSAPDELLDRRRLYADLLDCIEQLSPKNRHTLVVRFVDDEASYADLAILLDEEASTLNRRVTRSMKTLRECLARKGRR
jgi:RNA polymerase sigma-70 factor, ECF subfamily